MQESRPKIKRVKCVLAYTDEREIKFTEWCLTSLPEKESINGLATEYGI